MAHWRSLLPPQTLLEVRYEDLVDDPERWSRRMLAHIGLPWDPRCLEFHRNDRPVLTAEQLAGAPADQQELSRAVAPLRAIHRAVARGARRGVQPMTTAHEFDLAVVGAGIVGMSCALAAARRGLKVAVIERNARACGASVRNFGLVTITGQDRADVWQRARRSREVWLEVAAQAGIPIIARGLWAAARRPESAAVLEAFMRSDMAGGCRSSAHRPPGGNVRS